MNTPGQITGDRQIPDGAISRRQIGEILYQHLADIRRREGVDPARYPAVDYDLHYDTRRTLYGAEVVARETADLMLPALLAGMNPDRCHWLPRLLRHPLLAAGAIVIAGYAGLRELSTSAARQQQAVQSAQADAASMLQQTLKDHQAEAVKLAEAQRREIERINTVFATNIFRKSFREAIGSAISANSPQVKITVGQEVVTLRIQDSLTRKENGVRIIEIKHGLTPVEVETLRKTVDTAKTVSIAK